MIGSKPANKRERAHMLACKMGPCIACLVAVSIKMLPPEWAQRGGDGLPMMEFNHCKSGNMRRGHLCGYALCIWHHHGTQRQPPEGFTHATARERWGPSLFDEAKLFHDLYGSDDELIEVQLWWLEQNA